MTGSDPHHNNMSLLLVGSKGGGGGTKNADSAMMTGPGICLQGLSTGVKHVHAKRQRLIHHITNKPTSLTKLLAATRHSSFWRGQGLVCSDPARAECLHRRQTSAVTPTSPLDSR